MIVHNIKLDSLAGCAMAAANTSRRALEGELRDLMRRPVEGFAVELKDDNIFEWAISMFGPPDSLYEGGYFKVYVGHVYF